MPLSLPDNWFDLPVANYHDGFFHRATKTLRLATWHPLPFPAGADVVWCARLYAVGHPNNHISVGGYATEAEAITAVETAAVVLGVVNQRGA